MVIKAIIFDCFGVLTTDTWQAFLDNLPPEANIEEARDAHRAYNMGLLDKEETAHRIKDATGKGFTEVEDVFQSEVAKNVALLECIREYKKRYKIGLLSNVATPWITESFLTNEEQELFDAMVLSYEVGITKPDPRIFHIMCERLGVKPEETVLVDDLERYTTAARDVGMQAVTYENLMQTKQQLDAILDQE